MIPKRSIPGLSIPRGVWVLGFVSLLMDVSSELIHSLLPVFMVSALGASAVAVGLVEGIAEATALIVKVFSGALSDYRGKRKEFAAVGYGLGALSKPLFALAQTVNFVFLARFIDRIGKGIRGAPRDALVADLTHESIRGAAYGLRQSLDTVGAFFGPLLAIFLMLVLSGNYRVVFWFAVIPGVLSVILLILGVREPPMNTLKKPALNPIQWKRLTQMGRAYWWVVVIGGVFALARFSEAFLILRARHLGVSEVLAPAVLVLMNSIYALSAYPAGWLADRLDRRKLLAVGLIVLIGSNLMLAHNGNLVSAAIGVGLWGLNMGLTQGLLAAMVAATAPSDLRGTAFGLFNLVSGIAMFISSVLAGLFWDRLGAPVTFYASATFSFVALILLFRMPLPLNSSLKNL